MESNISQEFKFTAKPYINEKLRDKNKQVNLVSNYIKISMKPQHSLIVQYSVAFEPEISSDNEKIRRLIYNELRKQFNENYSPFVISGDSIFSLCLKEKKSFPAFIQKETNIKEYTVTVEPTQNRIDLASIKNSSKFSQKVKSFVEIVIKNIIRANEGMVRFNKSDIFNYFETNKVSEETANAFLMSGFNTSTILTESGLYLRVNSKNKFINAKTCLERIIELSSQYKGFELCKAVLEEFIDKSIMATYGKHQVYTVKDVSFDMNVMNKRIIVKRNKQTQEITLREYYRDEYSIQISKPDQPLFIATRKNIRGEEENVYLVPELFYLTAMDDEMKKQLSLKKNFASKTKVTPNDRLKRIHQFKDLIYKQYQPKRTIVNKYTGEKSTQPDPDDIRKQWGFEIGDYLLTPGRILDPPKIKFKDSALSVTNGGFRNGKAKDPKSLSEWVVISSQYNLKTAKDMVTNLQKCSFNLGIDVQTPNYLTYNERHIDDVMDFLSENLLNNYKIILVVLERNSNNKSWYKGFKNYCNCKIGVPLQVVLKENASNNLSYYSSVLCQMVAKMKGRLYEIYIDDYLSTNSSIILGYSTSNLDNKKKKKCVMTASYNCFFSNFYTDEIIVDIKKTRDEKIEITNPFITLLRRCLDYFSKVNGQNFLPKFILIYRSGVSEKEKEYLFQHEVSPLTKFLSGNLIDECYKEKYSTQFCYVTVNKRTNSKFYEYANEIVSNPKEGTVIDTQVTGPDNFEFFLQPQLVKFGTATPTHFHCLYNNKADILLEQLENITYKMCYYYWNWPGAIREPACLKYAEVANKFSSTYLKEEVRDSLKDTPYFI